MGIFSVHTVRKPGFLMPGHIYKYSGITDRLLADSPTFSSPIASAVMIHQNFSLKNFPVYGIMCIYVYTLYLNLVSHAVHIHCIISTSHCII